MGSSSAAGSLIVKDTSVASSARAERTSSIYLEAFGKGGIWGVGYDHRLDERFRLGIVGSAERFGAKITSRWRRTSG